MTEDQRGIADFNTATKLEDYTVKLHSRSTDGFGQVDLVVSNASVPNVALPTPWHKDRPIAGHAAAVLAFATGLLIASLGAAADERARTRPIAERAGTANIRGHPIAKQFAPPNQPDISASDAGTVDAIYRLLMGPQPTISSDSRVSIPPLDSRERR
jgi:hypothetical protein